MQNGFFATKTLITKDMTGPNHKYKNQKWAVATRFDPCSRDQKL